MAKQSKKFLEILKKKLSYGSTRSILINCIPGKLASRMSVTDLDVIKKGMSSEFIKQLTSEQSFDFKFSIKYDNDKVDLFNNSEEIATNNNSKKVKLEKRISSIKYDNDDYLKEHGVETFAIGFPILVRRNPNDITKVIASPIFIFPLRLKQSFDKAKEWIISRDQESGIKINEALRSYLKSENHIELPTIPDEMLDDGVLEKNEIETFILSLSTKLNIKLEKEINWNSLDEIPEKINVESEVVGESRIILSGVFGNYKSQKQSLINDIEGLLRDENDYEDLQIGWDQKNSPVEVDPSQNHVLRSIANKNKIVIQGPPGTGKSQTLTAIITTALANKKKVLVVCEKRTALEVIYNNIVNKYPNLKYSIALIEDVTTDRSKIAKTVREREMSSINYYGNNNSSNNITADLDYFENLTNTVDHNYQSLREHIHEDKRWIDCVAKWISYKIEKERIPFYDKLSKANTFDLSKISNQEVESKISEASNLYLVAKSVINEYDQLLNTNVANISTESYIEILKNNQFELNYIASQIDEISIRYIKKARQANEEMIDLVLNKIKELDDLLQELKSYLTDPFKPKLFEKIKIYFNSRKKEINKKISLALELHTQVENFLIKHELIDNSSKENYCELHKNIAQKKSQLVESMLQEVGHDESFNPQLFTPDDEKDYQILIERALTCNNSIEPITNNLILPIPKTLPPSQFLKKLKSINNSIQILLQKETQLIAYLKWKTFLKNCSVNQFEFINNLIQLNSSDWLMDYRISLIYKILYKNFHTNNYPNSSKDLSTIKSLITTISSKQEEIIRQNLKEWYIKGVSGIENNNLTLKKLYNLKGSSGNTRNSLRKIVTFNPDSFTDLHPLILSNPTTCSTLFPLKHGFFDLVIFDEASQLRIEETYSSVFRGKTVIVSGDSQQMPPSSYFESNKNIIDDSDSDDENAELIDQISEESSIDMATKESLLDWAIDEGYHETYLDMHYRSKHPDLIEFSNTCFYNSRLIPMPAEIEENPIFFKQINGLYDKRVNETEGLEVLSIIKNIIPDNKSVGVATFNLTQRNLILDLINKERGDNPDFNSKMSQLEENGFFVKNLENIQGDERDIIILSTTFGKKKDGRFIMNFGPITQKNGHRLLNVIITRAKEKVIVLTSIPEERQSEFRTLIESEYKVTGKSGLLAYLAYSRAVSTKNEKEKEEILSFIKQKINQTRSIQNSKIGLTESPFEEEVYQFLVSEFGTENIIPQFKCGGFRIDLVVKSPKTGKNIAIECDGAAYHSSELNWHHDIYRQNQLEKQGFIFHRIWSTNWFKNFEHECQSLIAFIKEN